MARYWFLTSTTYATWLPGDVRGFVSDVEQEDGAVVRPNVPGTDYDRDRPDMVQAARERLKGPPIYFQEPEAHCALDSFLSTCEFRSWVLLAGSVMGNHFHLVVGVPGDPEPETLLQKFKGHGSRCLNEQFGRQPSATWWTRGGSTRNLKDHSGEDALHDRAARDAGGISVPA